MTDGKPMTFEEALAAADCGDPACLENGPHAACCCGTLVERLRAAHAREVEAARRDGAINGAIEGLSIYLGISQDALRKEVNAILARGKP